MADLKPVKLNLSRPQILKASKGQNIRLTDKQIDNGHIVHLHPDTVKKIKSCKRKNKGCTIRVSIVEMDGDKDIYEQIKLKGGDLKGTGMEGGSIWSWLSKAAKDAGRWVHKAGKDAAEYTEDKIIPFVKKNSKALAKIGFDINKLGNFGNTREITEELRKLIGVGVKKGGLKQIEPLKEIKPIKRKTTNLKKGGSFKLAGY